jgi:uncharacterized protein YbjT (DUF2867 family)
MNDPILVTGATGSQGNAVARALLARGHQVRALTRDPAKDAAQALAGLGAEVVTGNFDDPASLRRAAAGTAAVFAMGTPFEIDPETEERQSLALVDAVHEAGTRHIVYTSVASSLDGTGIPHFESKAVVERHLAELETPWTVIAPVAFLENVSSPWVAPALAQGVYGFSLPADVPLQQVAIGDLADFAVLVFEQPERFAGQRIELASAELTGAEFAAALSRWLGREVRYQEAPLDGLDADMRAMIDFFRRGGYTVDIPALRAAYPEIGWRDLETWAAEQDWAGLTAARPA